MILLPKIGNKNDMYKYFFLFFSGSDMEVALGQSASLGNPLCCVRFHVLGAFE